MPMEYFSPGGLRRSEGAVLNGKLWKLNNLTALLELFEGCPI